PTHTALLLRILADVLFRYRRRGRKSSRKSGHKKKWDHTRLCKLGAQRAALATPYDTKAAAEIKRLYPAEYRRDSAVTIRQKLRSARMEYEKAKDQSRLKERNRLKRIKRSGDKFPVEKYVE